MMDRSRWGIFLPKGETQKSKKEEKDKEIRRASKDVALSVSSSPSPIHFSLRTGDPTGDTRAYRVTSTSASESKFSTSCDSADKRSKTQSKSAKNSPVLFSGTHLFQLRNKIMMNFGHGGFSNILGKQPFLILDIP